MVSIFARSITDDLTSLVKKLDAIVKDKQDSGLKSLVVMITDDADSTESELTKLAKSEGISSTPLTLFDGIAGPPNYSIAQDAEVTVTMWNERLVEANFAYQKSELNAEEIEKIISQTILMVGH